MRSPPSSSRATGRLGRAALGALLALLALLAPRLAHAQDAAPTRQEGAVCLGFSFGPWTPPLDWQAAGHGAAMDSSGVAMAPGGRGWAASDSSLQSMSTVMLFPPWWPVGVAVELGTAAPAPGDTVAGRAHALVNDGRLTPPTSRVRAWRVPCGRP